MQKIIRYLTIPNLLVLARIFLTIVLAYYIINGWFQYAVWVLIAIKLTDILDGQTARIFHLITRYGAYFDGITDIFFQEISIFFLCLSGNIPLWGLIILFVRISSYFSVLFTTKKLRFGITPLITFSENLLIAVILFSKANFFFFPDPETLFYKLTIIWAFFVTVNVFWAIKLLRLKN